jgi:hypothetical protein
VVSVSCTVSGVISPETNLQKRQSVTSPIYAAISSPREVARREP